MMKTLAMLLPLVMLLSLCACTNTDNLTTYPNDSSQSINNTANSTGSTECSHIWKDPTCSAPMTCAKCGKINGEAAGHNWEDATLVAPKTCSKCGITEGGVRDIVDVLQGSWAYPNKWQGCEVVTFSGSEMFTSVYPAGGGGRSCTIRNTKRVGDYFELLLYYPAEEYFGDYYPASEKNVI